MDADHAQDIVALRKESVDRNIARGQLPTTEPPSLSARRAWIEIANFCRNRFCPTVALRKESVDRNTNLMNSSRAANVALRKESVDRNVKIMSVSNGLKPSLSARRAWIEIADVYYQANAVDVALRKESVDRNSTGLASFRASTSRSPQGERG